MWNALKYRPFARLFGAALISEIGTKIHRIALLVLVYSLSKEAYVISLVLGVQLVAAIGFGPLLAVWADSRERRRLLVLTDVMRAPLVCLIPLIGITSLPLLLVLVFMIEILRSLHDPVTHAVVPELLPQEHVDAANGLMQFAQRFGEVAFVGLAGALVAVVGAEPAFWIDAGTYLVSALILLKLPALKPAQQNAGGYFTRVRAGIGFVFKTAAVRRVTLTLFAAAMFGSIEVALGVVLAVSVLHAGSAGFGIMEAGAGLGAIAGTLLVPRLTARFPRERVFLYGLLAFGLFEAATGAFPVLGWVVVAYTVCGIANMLFIVPSRSILQLNTPPELRGRVFAAFGALMNSAVLIGTMLAGGLEHLVGASATFVIAGTVVSLVALFALLADNLAARNFAPRSQPLPDTVS